MLFNQFVILQENIQEAINMWRTTAQINLQMHLQMNISNYKDMMENKIRTDIRNSYLYNSQANIKMAKRK
jgi:hypothetical protein